METQDYYNILWLALWYLLVGSGVVYATVRQQCRRLRLTPDEYVLFIARLRGHDEHLVARLHFRFYRAWFYAIVVMFWPMNLRTWL